MPCRHVQLEQPLTLFRSWSSPGYGELSDQELIEIVAARREERDDSWEAAWEALHELRQPHRPYAWRVNLVLSPLTDTEREMACDQVWDKVFANLPASYRPGSFRAWLLQITRNCLSDYLDKGRNKRRSVTTTDPADAAPTPEQAAIGHETRARVEACLECLRAERPEWHAVFRAFQEAPPGKEYETIHGRLHLEPARAQKLVFNARHWLRTRL
jgi:hypothetical protein